MLSLYKKSKANLTSYIIFHIQVEFDACELAELSLEEKRKRIRNHAIENIFFHSSSHIFHSKP